MNCSDYAQTYKMASDLIAKGAQTIKMAYLAAKKILLVQKIVEKTGFSGYSGQLQENNSQKYRIAQFRFSLTD